MSHPSNDALFSAAQGDAPADLAAHVAGCDACASRLRRLRGGAEALREAKRSVPDISWSALDVVMAREAEAAAREVRLRPASDRPMWLRPFAFGAGLAAVGALAVVAVTLRAPPAAPPPPVASRAVAPPAPATPARRPVEATVLLSTRGALWRQGAGGAASRLTDGVLREGARIETARGDRAVLSLQRGARMDLRGESLASLTRLREGSRWCRSTAARFGSRAAPRGARAAIGRVDGARRGRARGAQRGERRAGGAARGQGERRARRGRGDELLGARDPRAPPRGRAAGA
ncbi:MAG: hypothetical protein R3A48_18480 [Polyangiales bacterium]